MNFLDIPRENVNIIHGFLLFQVMLKIKKMQLKLLFPGIATKVTARDKKSFCNKKLRKIFRQN